MREWKKESLVRQEKILELGMESGDHYDDEGDEY